MARQFIYHMQGLTKTYPGNRKVLENINLSFYPDAKIGVLGLNGSGKSTLLRIMAGIDTEFNGEGWVAEGARVGYLPQEPQLDANKSVRENVMEGVAAQKADPRPLQRARHELFGRDRGRDDEAPGRDRGEGPVGSRFQGRPGHGGPGLPARRRRGHPSLGRREAPRRAVQAAAGPAGAAAAGRAHQPSRRRDGELARRPFAQISRRDPDRHPRPLLPRQRDRLDSRARSRPRHSLSGQLFVLARAEAEAARAGGPRGGIPPEDARPRAGVDRGEPARPPGEVQGALSALRGPARQGGGEGADHRPDRHPGRRAARPERHRLRAPEQGVRRQSPDRRPHLQAAAGRHRRHHRPQRRRQDHAVPHDHRAGAARQRRASRSGNRSSSAMSTSRATASTARRPCGRRFPAASTSSSSASAR